MEEYSVISSRSRRIIISAFFIAAGIAIALSGSIYGISFGDSSYMLFNVRNPEGGPVAMLTFWIAHEWCEFFGFSIESLCWLRSVCNILTFGIGCAWFGVKTGRFLRASILFFMLCGLGEFCFAHYFNWDVSVYPWYVVNVIIALEYLRHPDTNKIILMGVFTAIITISRLPAVLCVVIDVGVVIYVWRKERGKLLELLQRMVIGIICFSVTFSIIAIMMCGSLSNYISSFTPANMINGHFDLSSIYFRFFLFIPVTSMWGGVLVLIAGAYFASCQKYGKWMRAVILVVTYIICWNVVRLVRDSSLQDWIFGFGQGLLLVALILAYIQNRQKELVKVSLLVIFLFAISGAVGSDSIAERLLGLPLLPLSLVYFKLDNERLRRTVNILMIELCIMGVYNQSYIYYSMYKGIYIKVDKLPNVGLQYIPQDEAFMVDWAIDAKPANDRLKKLGIKVGYMTGYPRVGEALLGENNPAWMNDFWIDNNDSAQRKRFNDYLLDCECIFFPTFQQKDYPGFVLIDDFVKENGYEVIIISPRCRIAVAPVMVNQVKKLLS